jgi:ribonuclease HI
MSKRTRRKETSAPGGAVATAGRQHFSVYTDGACHPNPGRGGWGAVILLDRRVQRELSGGEEVTTNNRMEMTAALEALRALPAGSLIDLHTDSKYLRDGITKWVAAWRKRNWRTQEGEAVKNQDLWVALDAAMVRHDVHWHWVKGHAGDQYNERADAFAEAAARVSHRKSVIARTAASDGMVDLFTAAAYSSTTQRGAWAVVLRWGSVKKVIAGAEPSTSANRMSLVAVLAGLAALKRPVPVRIFCANDYVVEGATRWLAGWQSRAWRTREGKDVVNRDLWQRIVEASARAKFTWVATGGIDQPELMVEAKEAARVQLAATAPSE